MSLAFVLLDFQSLTLLVSEESKKKSVVYETEGRHVAVPPER